MIELDGVSKIYSMQRGNVAALNRVSLTIGAGEFVSIVGASGSGKSTLLYLLGLLTNHSHGIYKLHGQEVGSLNDRELSIIRGREVGFIFQSFHLVPQLTVLGNVMLAARYANNPNGGINIREAKNLIDRVGLGSRIDHKPFQLSGGEMQRVAIARALLTKPSLILADEPTGNLDEANGSQIFDLLKTLNDEGRTIILVTHDATIAARTPRLIRLRDGEVVDEAA